MREHSQTSLLSSLGLVAALGAFVGASCCVLPFALAWAGLAGAWIAHLELFATYRRPLMVVALAVIAAGWWVAVRRRVAPRVFIILGCATVLVVAALALIATVVAALEQTIGKPLITSTQATLWHALRLAGIKALLFGYGRLLQEH
jgi:mercuric ion transport protein